MTTTEDFFAALEDTNRLRRTASANTTKDALRTRTTSQRCVRHVLSVFSCIPDVADSVVSAYSRPQGALMDTDTGDIEIIVTEDFWALVKRAAAALKMTPEAFVLEASVASAIKLLPDRADATPGETPHQPI
jgi:hypothetical protein